MKFELIWGLFKSSKKFTLIFVLNFALGISGLFFLEYFKDLLQGSLDLKAKIILGSELSINSRFPIEEDVRSQLEGLLPPIKNSFSGMSMNSMVASAKRGRLVQLIKLGEGFPYYGGLEFSDKQTYPDLTMLPDESTIWVYPEILAQLEVKDGDVLKIGSAEFKIGKVIVRDSFKSLRFSGFVPRIYLTEAAIKRATLVQSGSTAEFSLNYVFQENLSLDQLDELEKRLEKKLGAAVSVRSPRDASDRVARMTQMIADFMSLISMICLLLSFVSLFYLYSGFLLKYRSDLKVFLELGIRKLTLIQILIGHFFIMTTLAVVIVASIAILIAPLAQKLVAQRMQLDLEFDLGLLTILKSIVILIFLAPSVVVPLFNRTISPKDALLSARTIFGYAPLALILLAVSAFVTTPPKVGLIFVLSILVTILVTSVVAFLLLRRLNYSGLGERLSLTLAQKSIVRKVAFSMPVGIALFLSSALFSLAPQIGGSLLDSIALEEGNKPRFFLFDIQDHQLEDLKSFLQQKGTALENISPMVRGRIIKHNGKDFSKEERSDSSDGENQELQNRTVNLSYRADLYSTEEIVEGLPFSKAQTPEVSIEKRYAERGNLKVGDSLVFDILGMEIDAKVVNIRSVKWTDFIPNFFILFGDGFINDAPKTLLATVPQSGIDPNQLVLDMGSQFPNISMVNVEEVIADIMALIGEVSSVLNWASLYCMILGLLMIFIIIDHQMTIRKIDFVRLKMIGVTLSQIRRSILYEFLMISGLGVSLGLGLAMIASWLSSVLIFEGQWSMQPSVVVFSLISILSIISLLVSALSIYVTQNGESYLFEEV